MIVTPAQRQAAYRARGQTAGENGERRISTWVTTAVALPLARFAQHQGITKREVLEKLLLQAQTRVTSRMDDEGLDEFPTVTR